MDTFRKWLKYLPPFLAGVLIFAFVTQYEQTVAMFNNIWGVFLFLVNRFIIGFGLAYFLNFLVRFFERKFKARRWVSLLVTYILFVGFLALMGWIVIPAVTDSVKVITLSLGSYNTQVQSMLERILVNLPAETAAVVEETVTGMTTALVNYMRELLNADFVGAAVGNFTRSFANIAFGLIISVYALWGKERLKAGAKRVMYAFAPRHVGDFTLELARDADANFSKFIIGKIWDSLIIGLLALIFFMVFQLPAFAFLAIVVGVTNMIPYFGPFAGGVICGVVLLGFGPWPCLIGVAIIVVLQIFDGAVLGPKILGDAVGISPLLTVISITVGGDLFGLAGIFFAVPVVGTFKNVALEKIIDARLAARGLDPDASASACAGTEALDGQIRFKE